MHRYIENESKIKQIMNIIETHRNTYEIPKRTLTQVWKTQDIRKIQGARKSWKNGTLEREQNPGN